jgi:hypothetical protein
MENNNQAADWLTMPERNDDGAIYAYISGDKIHMNKGGEKTKTSFIRGVLQNISMKEANLFDLGNGKSIPAKRKHVFTFLVHFDANSPAKKLHLEFDAADGSAAQILNVLAALPGANQSNQADYQKGNPILQITAYLNDSGKPRVSVKTPNWDKPGDWKHPEKAYPYTDEQPNGGIPAKATQNAAGVWDFSEPGKFWHGVFQSITGEYETKGSIFDSPFVPKK